MRRRQLQRAENASASENGSLANILDFFKLDNMMLRFTDKAEGV